MIDWQAIIEKHGQVVWQTSYRLLGNHADASDCFQETFVSALKFCRRQRVRDFSALLTRFATARAIDQLRRRFRQSSCMIDVDDSEYSERIQSNDPGPALQAQQQELTIRLRESLCKLPQQEAMAFCLRYLSDMSYQQIGSELGISVNAAGVLLHRARTKLRKSFELLEKEKK